MTLIVLHPTRVGVTPPPRGSGLGPTVPWGQVLPLAVVLSFANGFWAVSLRGAVGAIERTSEPFSSWWHESAMLVPAYVVAVLGAFAISVRLFGRRPLGFRRGAAVIALVAAAGTVAGALLLAASSVVDLRLQVAILDHMSLFHPGCDPSCLAARKEASLEVLSRSVGLGAALMAVTDLVLVGLVVAFRGGRLALASRRVSRPTRTPSLHLLLAAALVGAAAVHAAVMPAHFGEWRAAGVFFLLLTAVELVAALAVLAGGPRLHRPSLVATVLVSLAPLVVWAASRTSGLPFGPDAGDVESIGISDVMACLLELVALIVAVRVLLARSAGHRHRWTSYRLAIGLVSVVALAAIGVGGSGIAGFTSFAGAGQQHNDVRQAGEGR